MKRIASALSCAILLLSPACRSTDDDAPAPEARDAASPDPAPDLAAARAAVEEGRLAEGIALARAVAEAEPSHLEAHLLLAGAYELGGRYEEALRAADRALEIDPRAVGALVTRSAALRDLGRGAEAAETAREALRLDPDSRAALWNLARVADEPTEPLRRLVALEPDAVEVRMALARALAARGRHAEAAEHAEEAARRTPEDPSIRVFLAGAHYESASFETAMDHAQAALRLDPDRSEALDLFRASFYVAVASELLCRHGDGPWGEEAVEPVLARFREQGLSDAEVFYDYQREFGDRPDIRRRIERAADCDAE